MACHSPSYVFLLIVLYVQYDRYEISCKVLYVHFCRMLLGERSCGIKKGREKGKGCDIGYALATSSCEGVDNVDACTVTALDAITAFTVPNPNYPSQSCRFFQVWLLLRLPC